MLIICFQCQEAANNTGCTIIGICGKSSTVSNLQDLVMYLLKGISLQTEKMRASDIAVPVTTNRFITLSLFMTITNANFDEGRFEDQIREAIIVREAMKQLLRDAGHEPVLQAECECTT